MAKRESFRWIGWMLLALLSVTAKTAAAEYDLVVAQDGSGNFRTVQKAFIKARRISRRTGGAPVRIYIKAGVYKEKLILNASNVTVVGEDPQRTVLTYDDYVGKPNGVEGGITGWEDSSVLIRGDDFTGRNLTIENSAAGVAQATALWVDGDRQRFFDCRILGNQDTLFTNLGREFYKRCYISGATDFIYGPGTAVFDRCTIFCTGSGYITAASTPEGNRGYLFKRCTITGTAPAESVYLGRPWRPYASVVFLRCDLGELIKPEGWYNWGDSSNESTAFYAEYHSTGPGADTSGRVPWSRQIQESEAADFSLKNMFSLSAASLSVMIAADDLWYRDNEP